MESLEPIINLLTVLTVLSVTAERLTNVIKLRRSADWDVLEARQKELRIVTTNLAVGMSLALVMKADLFAMLAQPAAPWSTLGWTQWDGSAWVQHAATLSAGGVLHAVLGSALTGAALGLGSSFWHDVLAIVFELKKQSQARTEAARALAPVSVERKKGAA